MESERLKKAWEALSEMSEGPIQDLNDVETGQLLMDLSVLESRSVRVIRGLEMKQMASQVVMVDEMHPMQEHISIIGGIAEGEARLFPIVLESRNAYPLMVSVISGYRFHQEVGFDYEVPLPIFHLAQLVDWNRPVQLAAILNRVVQVDFVEGRKTTLDDLPNYVEKEISFTPVSGPVEILQDAKLGVVIEASHAREILQLTIRKLN